MKYFRIYCRIIVIYFIFFNLGEWVLPSSNSFQDQNSNENIIPLSSNTLITNHAPIFIDGNNNLDAFCSGNDTDGTETKPHIIKNMIIEVPDEGFGIYINNTTKFLIIQNCTIFNNSYAINASGILLENVTFVNIKYCVSNRINIGIKIFDSRYCNISNLSSYDCSIGLSIENSSNCNYYNSTATNNYFGIKLRNCIYSNISNSIISENIYGFYIQNSSNLESINLTIQFNDFGITSDINFSRIGNCNIEYNYYFGVDLFLESSEIVNNFIQNNGNELYDGVGLYFGGYNSIINNNTISDNKNNGIVCNKDSRNLTISNNIICNNGLSGINIFPQFSNPNSNALNFKIEDNTVMNNNGDGLRAIYLSNSNITNNLIYNNLWNGIFFQEYCVVNSIILNDIIQNKENGIFLTYHTGNNIIRDNYITDNGGFCIRDYGVDNNCLDNNGCIPIHHIDYILIWVFSIGSIGAVFVAILFIYKRSSRKRLLTDNPKS